MLLLATKLDFVAGRVQGHRDGFGFLVRDDGGPDIFLSPREMLKVLHGDRVLVKPGGEYRGKPGRQYRRGHRTPRPINWWGVSCMSTALSIVVPEDQRIKHDIPIPPSDTNGAQHGQVVSVEIIEQPTRHTQPLGRVAEVLGEIDDPGMEIEIAVRKFDVPVEFSEAARKQAARLPDAVRKTDLKDRIDLRDVPLITIDGEDARDFDDAVYCERGGAGLGPAQAAGLAPAGRHRRRQPLRAPNDAAGRRRGGARHQRVFPAPGYSHAAGNAVERPVFAESACRQAGAGLRHGDPRQRRARRARSRRYQFYNAVIAFRMRAPPTRTSGPRCSSPAWPAAQAMAGVMPQVRDLYDLYQLLRQARRKRGAIDFDTVETKIVCNELGRIEQIVGVVRNDAHKLIEECMLAANTCAADFMARSKHPGLYRIHEGPHAGPPAIACANSCARMGLSAGRRATRPTAKDYGEFLDSVRADVPTIPCLQTMCLRSMQQAMYSPENVGHFGLAYPAYTHFTSPIRRYPDLLTHRVIKALLHGQRYVPSLEDEPVVIGRVPQGARARHLGKAGPAALVQRTPRRRGIARRGGLAEVLVRQGARRRGLQRHGDGGR